MFNLSPKEDKFFDMFIELSQIILQSSAKLKEFISAEERSEEKYMEIKNLERAGDQKIHLIFEELNKTFITPIDREDIHMISMGLDNIIDAIESTASWFFIFNITKTKPYAAEYCDFIEDSCTQIAHLIKELKVMKKSSILYKKIVEINNIEDNADILFRKSLKELFDGTSSDLEVIKWKQIYEGFEEVINSCEDVANIIEGVVMKNA